MREAVRQIQEVAGAVQERYRRDFGPRGSGMVHERLGAIFGRGRDALSMHPLSRSAVLPFVEDTPEVQSGGHQVVLRWSSGVITWS